MAFFESTDDVLLLHRMVEEIAPRAKRLVGGYLAKGGEDSVPPPADLRPARTAATADAAVRTLRATDDFALLQALARCVGRRIEAIEIVASAEFPEGARVVVPAKVSYPPSGTVAVGVVEATGTVLRVRLDSGESWEGPPSLARRESPP